MIFAWRAFQGIEAARTNHAASASARLSLETPQAFSEQVNTMLAGYASVSTLDQNSGLQLDALSAAGCERIFEDRASGARSNLPGLAEAPDWCCFQRCLDGDFLK